MTCSYNNNSKCDIYYRYITRNLSKRLGDVVYVLYRCVLGEWWTRSQNASVECLPVQSSAGYLIDSHQTNLGRWQSAKAGGKRKVEKKPRTGSPASTTTEYHYHGHGHRRTYYYIITYRFVRRRGKTDMPTTQTLQITNNGHLLLY
jgi:hypothetical protein